MVVVLFRKESRHLVRRQKWNSSHRNVLVCDDACSSQKGSKRSNEKGIRFSKQNITKRRSQFGLCVS